MALPCKHDGRHLVAQSRDPIRKAISEEEECCKAGEIHQCKTPGTRLGWTQTPILWANETVKIPQSSVNCPILRKPAASTN